MALQSITKLFIGGTEVPTFQRIILSQDLATHHELEITCRMDVLEDLNTSLAEESKNFLGESITLNISSEDDYEGYGELEFKGIVTQVKNIKGFGQISGDQVVIIAQSPTFLTDDGPHNASYLDTTISAIINSTFQEYDQSKLELLIQPEKDSTLHYAVQQNESCFAFGARLAAQYGEWFYYDGKKLVFGKPGDEEISLKYNFDLKEYDLNLIPKSHNYKFYTNDYLLDEIHEKDAKEINVGANGYSGFVANKAKVIFNKETKIWHNLYNDPKTKKRLEEGVEVQKKAIESLQVKLSGVSDNPGIKIGCIVKITEGSFRIIEITHSTNENGDYENRFEAVTAEISTYPYTNITAYPKSETQTAVVMENSDPDGLGRLKVQFPWQKDLGETTPWVRVMAPHAGGDKGFHFMPEIGEEVLIGFEGGNAERPFVMGSLYNGSKKASAFHSANNDIKSIRTRSGHTVELNDTEGEEAIKIYDNEGSIIIFDTKKKSLFINATEDIVISARNIKIVAEENIDIQAKKDINTASEENTFVSSEGKTLIQADMEMSLTSKSSITAEALTDLNLKGVNLNAEATVKAMLKGTQAAVEGKVTLIQGASGKIDVM